MRISRARALGNGWVFSAIFTKHVSPGDFVLSLNYDSLKLMLECTRSLPLDSFIALLTLLLAIRLHLTVHCSK